MTNNEMKKVYYYINTNNELKYETKMYYKDMLNCIETINKVISRDVMIVDFFQKKYKNHELLNDLEIKIIVNRLLKNIYIKNCLDVYLNNKVGVMRSLIESQLKDIGTIREGVDVEGQPLNEIFFKDDFYMYVLQELNTTQLLEKLNELKRIRK